MKLLLIWILSIFNLPEKLPGSGVARLQCKSESGRTVFSAELQDIDGLLEKAELSIDGSKLLFTADDHASTVFDAETGVFTLVLEGQADKKFPNGRILKFWVIPNTFKIIESNNSSEKYEFRAKLTATEPRPGKLLLVSDIELKCILTHKT